MHLDPIERWLLVAGFVSALAVGGLFGYAAYLDGSERQFHGGVLPEDEAEAFWSLVLDGAGGFCKFAVLSFVVFPVVPVVLRRWWSARHGNDV